MAFEKGLSALYPFDPAMEIDWHSRPIDRSFLPGKEMQGIYSRIPELEVERNVVV
jgi:hypothetical protein